MNEDQYYFTPVAYVNSCFKEKFGIPRQPGLATQTTATIELVAPYNIPEAVDGLTNCSHLWLQFIFHENKRSEWKPKVKPPRLGGNQSMGVFATRAPTRPNAIGLSVVKLDRVSLDGGVAIHISGHDLLDGTPILDIKPYVPYADAISHATNQFAESSPVLTSVRFTPEARAQLHLKREPGINIEQLIVEVLAQDPRPAYQKHDPNRIYGMAIHQWDLQWCYEMVAGIEEILVVNIT